jgi:molybdenum cofactor synthesis domain-containing protein
MIPVESALACVLAETPVLPAEDVLLAECAGRVLAEDVFSDLDLPPFDRAAMDGFALRAGDTAAAPVLLRVVGEVRAGQVLARDVGPGEAVRIMTGAPVPGGADAVQQVEKTRAPAAHQVEVLAPVAPGANVATRGCEVRSGQRVLAAGAAVDPAVLAVLATAGRTSVRVGRRPRVALVVTGDELVEPGARPVGGQVRNSNGWAIAAQATAAGAVVRDLGMVGDDLARLAETLRRGLEEAEVLVCSGGVSEGAYDLVEPALDRLGVQRLFTKVAIKPGAPLVFGRRGDRLVFGLPGNPVSAQVTFDLFVRAALRRMQGALDVERPRVEVVLTGPVRNRSGRKAFSPAVVRFEGGRLLAEPVRSAGSADVVAHARADVLVVLEADQPEAGTGERVLALVLPRFGNA